MSDGMDLRAMLDDVERMGATIEYWDPERHVIQARRADGKPLWGVGHYERALADIHGRLKDEQARKPV